MAEPRLVIISGAGLSAESGISTFRDKNGLWEQYKIEDVAMGYLVERNKVIINKFYNERRAELANAKPNAAHFAIAELQHQFGPDRVQHFTQNIDDLMEKAGAPQTTHVHGTMWQYECIECGHVWDIEGYAAVPLDATCPKCLSTRLRPHIIMFGDQAPLYTPMYQAIRTMEQQDTIVVIGTSGNVLPYAYLVGSTRRKDNGLKILMTKEASAGGVNGFDLMFFDPIGESLPRIKELFVNRLNGVE